MIVEGILIAMVSYGAYRVMRTQARARRYLELSGDEAPLQLAHLNPEVARLLQETRSLRLSLEGTVRVAEELLKTDLMRTQDDFETAGVVFMDASRDVVAWLKDFDSLGEGARARLQDMGASPESVRALMVEERWSFEIKTLKVKGRETLDRRIRVIIGQLMTIELAMQSRSRGYR
jgi:hypothetical protein